MELIGKKKSKYRHLARFSVDKTSKEYYSRYEEKGETYESADIVWNRSRYKIIKEWVKEGSKVLDLGCGEGSLGAILIREKQCEVYGIEIDEKGVEQAIKKGVKAIVGDLDMGLNFPDNSFDYVVLNETLYMVYNPKRVLKEALRVGKEVIVSFPNFAFWYARLELLSRGVFPKSVLYGYNWYDTRQIHLFSYKDFTNLVTKLNARVTRREFEIFGGQKSFLPHFLQNLFSRFCIISVTRR